MIRFSHALHRSLLALRLALSLCASVLAAFPDTEDHWASDAVDYWTQREILSGYPDGSFHPDDSISRAEAAKVIARILHLRGTAGARFSDVSAFHWAYADVEACAANGVIVGYNRLFRPQDSISRQEAMTILYRASRYSAEDPEGAVDAMPDGAEVADWAKAAVGTLLSQGVVTGLPDGTIGPAQSISRTEFVTLLHRIDREGMWSDFSIPPIRLVWQQESLNLPAQILDGEAWLFLPAAADLTALDLSVEDMGETEAAVTFRGNLGRSEEAPLDLTALAAPEPDGSYLLTVTVSNETSSRTADVRIQ